MTTQTQTQSVADLEAQIKALQEQAKAVKAAEREAQRTERAEGIKLVSEMLDSFAEEYGVTRKAALTLLRAVGAPEGEKKARKPRAQKAEGAAQAEGQTEGADQASAVTA